MHILAVISATMLPLAQAMHSTLKWPRNYIRGPHINYSNQPFNKKFEK